MSAGHAFVAELGTEELPPKSLRKLMDAFRRGVEEGLAKNALPFESVLGFASPRRLAVKVTGLGARQADQVAEHRGPPVKIAFDASGAPGKAATGFADTHGVSVDALERVSTPKGEWLFYRSEIKGAPASELLPAIVEQALEKLPIQRRMRWGDSSAEFVRPVHWLLMLLDEDVLPARLFGITAGRETRGHRVHGPGPFVLKDCSEYPSVLEKKGRVIADFDARRKVVMQQLGAAAQAAGGAPVMDDALLDEVTALVEWPVAIEGSIPESFLALPDDVLIATLQDHQRYFPLRSGDGRLMPTFITISNIESKQPDQVRKGNERVVRPRLADAEFFYREDRKVALAERVAHLDDVMFQKKLGSLGAKTKRVEQLAGSIAKACGAKTAPVQRAALLSRCDLLTRMVGEFPELQGVMGRYYAIADGEPPEVAAAISEMYLPRFAGDSLPGSAAGRALSIADKLDTLLGIFAIGQPPSGTRDPFGLRRAALGVLRIIIECDLDLDLARTLDTSMQLMPEAVRGSKVPADVFAYMLERLRAYYLDNPEVQGVTPEMFDAVLSKQPGRPLDFQRRLFAVRDFMALDAAASLAAANKRTANILKKAKLTGFEKTDPAIFEEPAEHALFAAMEKLSAPVAAQIANSEYTQALARLAELREPVDAFFDSVLVMAEQPRLRYNRLALLQELHALFSGVADISRLSPS